MIIDFHPKLNKILQLSINIGHINKPIKLYNNRIHATANKVYIKNENG